MPALLKSYLPLVVAAFAVLLPRTTTAMAMEPASFLLVGTGLLGSLRLLRNRVQALDLIKEEETSEKRTRI